MELINGKIFLKVNAGLITEVLKVHQLKLVISPILG
jgi:hypothetical protein